MSNSSFINMNKNYITAWSINKTFRKHFKKLENQKAFNEVLSKYISKNDVDLTINRIFGAYKIYLNYYTKHNYVYKKEYENLLEQTHFKYKELGIINYFDLFDSITEYAVNNYISKNCKLTLAVSEFMYSFYEEEQRLLNVKENIVKLKDTQNQYVKDSLTKTVETLRSKKILKRKSDFDLTIDSLSKTIPCVHLNMNMKNNDAIEILKLIQEHFNNKYSEQLGE